MTKDELAAAFFFVRSALHPVQSDEECWAVVEATRAEVED
jgi:hypothetical protein